MHFTGDTTNSPQVFVADASQDFGDENTWYMDSGATTHITNELGNLQISSDFNGAESVMVGNGNHIPILSIGRSSFSSPVSTSHKSLFLNNILYVPQIAKNLLSISQFTYDNNVLIEFHYDCCLVKDKTSHKVLLKGSLVNGLYHIDLSSLSIKSATTCSSLSPSASVSAVGASSFLCNIGPSFQNNVTASNLNVTPVLIVMMLLLFFLVVKLQILMSCIMLLDIQILLSCLKCVLLLKFLVICLNCLSVLLVKWTRCIKILIYLGMFILHSLLILSIQIYGCLLMLFLLMVFITIYILLMILQDSLGYILLCLNLTLLRLLNSFLPLFSVSFLPKLKLFNLIGG